MTDDKYGGWKNRETWNVNLWLANDEPLYRGVRQMAEEAQADSNREEAPFVLADRIQEFVESLVIGHDLPDSSLERVEYMEGGIRTDLLLGALSRVDWQEIAEAWLED